MLSQISLSSPPWELVVLPDVGARLHALRYDGVDLLRTPTDPRVHLEDPLHWGSYVMAPWCNRLHRVGAEVLGRSLALAPDFAGPSAIHGQVSAVPWHRVDEATFEVTCGGDGWPWRYQVRQDIGVSDAGVTIGVALRNLDDAPMPGGLGIHPWFAGAVSVAIPAARVQLRNAERATEPVAVDARTDMRASRLLRRSTDSTWSSLSHPTVHVRRADAEAPEIRFSFSHAAAYVAAARPEAFEATAVEPQTHAPDGLDRLLAGVDGGLAVLGGGEQLRVSYTFEGGTRCRDSS